MGVHTGDSTGHLVAPIFETLTRPGIPDHAGRVVRGESGDWRGNGRDSNIQFGVNPDNGRMVVIEMNPRVSRSSALAKQGDRFSHRENRGEAGGGLSAGRNPERHHARGRRRVLSRRLIT